MGMGLPMTISLQFRTNFPYKWMTQAISYLGTLLPRVLTQIFVLYTDSVAGRERF